MRRFASGRCCGCFDFADEPLKALEKLAGSSIRQYEPGDHHSAWLRRIAPAGFVKADVRQCHRHVSMHSADADHFAREDFSLAGLQAGASVWGHWP
jgi:hypothetical protein